MATLNYAFKEISCKIVYYGPGLGGKTTNIKVIFNAVPAKSRGELVSLATEQDRTLFFDFLPLNLGEVKGFRTKFQIYTVPGQVFYNATRKLVLRGVDGIVFVADSQRDRLQDNIESMINLEENLAEYAYSLRSIPYVIQYNKRDLPDISSIEELERAINAEKVQYFEAIALRGTGVKETLKGISALVLSKLSRISTQAADETELEEMIQSIARKESSAMQPAGQLSTSADTENIVEVAAASPPTVLTPASSRLLKPRAAESAAGHGPLLNVKQHCHIRWVGIRIGSGVLELRNRPHGGPRGSYQLTGTVRFFYIIKTALSKVLKLLGEEIKILNGEDVPFLTLSAAPDNQSSRKTDLYMWVRKNINQDFYIRYHSRFGEIHITPEGESPI
jgi:signal recognition particle receptor subunit beta